MNRYEGGPSEADMNFKAPEETQQDDKEREKALQDKLIRDTYNKFKEKIVRRLSLSNQGEHAVNLDETDLSVEKFGLDTRFMKRNFRDSVNEAYEQNKDVIPEEVARNTPLTVKLEELENMTPGELIDQINKAGGSLKKS